MSRGRHRILRTTVIISAMWCSRCFYMTAFSSLLTPRNQDAGRRRALTQEAEAAYDSRAAEYRQAVLMAFEEVEDNLAALRTLADEAQQQDRATETSQRSLDLALNRYRAGVTTYLDVITAQNALLANQRAAVGIRTRRMQAAVLLTKAVGGGWRRSELPSQRDLRKQ